jgi:hypothetical protein
LSLKLWEEHRPRRIQVLGSTTELRNNELYALYSSPNIIRVIRSRKTRWAGHVAGFGYTRRAYTVLVKEPEETRPFEIPRSRVDDNIKMDLGFGVWGPGLD